MTLLARLRTAWDRRQDRRRQRRLLQRLDVLRAIGRQDPWPCTDRYAGHVLAGAIRLAAERGESPDLAEALRRTGVVVREEEGLAAACGADVRLLRRPDGLWSLLLDAEVSGFAARAAMAWALDRRVAATRADVCEILDAGVLARAVLAAPRHPLLRILLPEAALARARAIHGRDLDALARRLRVPPALLASALA